MRTLLRFCGLLIRSIRVSFRLILRHRFGGMGSDLGTMNLMTSMLLVSSSFLTRPRRKAVEIAMRACFEVVAGMLDFQNSTLTAFSRPRATFEQMMGDSQACVLLSSSSMLPKVMMVAGMNSEAQR